MSAIALLKKLINYQESKNQMELKTEYYFG